MNKVINKKRYDTDSAACVCENWNGLPPSNCDYFRETLYVKRTGEYFLYYAGGALSQYSKTDGANRWGIDGIKPLTNSEAMSFCQQYADADTYEKYFGISEQL